MSANLYIGLMSGTSLDGVDVAVVEFGGSDEIPSSASLVAFESYPYESDLREAIRVVADGESLGAEPLCALGFDLGERFAAAVIDTLQTAGIDPASVIAIGSHGQTVWHVPPGPDRPGSTLQVGEAAVIAERTGIPVVADFRVRDVAAGGHGAPLSPYFDLLLLSSDRPRAIQNIGGMANVTALPALGSEQPLAFDTGPGVALIDAAVRRLTVGTKTFDEDGRMATSGQVLEEALGEWLEDPFFSEPPPRSTGRERFGTERVDRWLQRHGGAAPEDLVATLTELTARTIAAAYQFIPFPLDEVYVCGGGARNPHLVDRLRRHLRSAEIRPLEVLGWNGDAREAAGFALLARQHVLRIPVDIGWATGAAGPRVLGKRVPA